MHDQLQSPPLYHPTYDTSPAQTIANEPWSFGLVHHHRQQHHLLHPQAPTEEEGDQVRKGGTSLPGGSIQTAPIQPASSSASIAEAKSACFLSSSTQMVGVESRGEEEESGRGGKRPASEMVVAAEEEEQASAMAAMMGGGGQHQQQHAAKRLHA